MSKLVGLSCLLFFRATYVASLSLCDGSNYLEVKEGQNNTFQCTGLTAQPDVIWLWGSFLLSTCTSTDCSNDRYPEYFQFTRKETTSSDVTVYPGTYPDLDYLATTSLSCQQGSGANKVTCQLDVVYPAEDPKCQIEFSGDTWEVTGWCNVSKALSRRNRYGCYLYQTSQQSAPTLVGNFIMNTRPIIGKNYSSGDCEISMNLPLEGKYNYSVIIIPGGVEVFPFFNGSNEIRRPSMSPQHTCPETVTEGEDVNCVCFSDDLGHPSGYLMWTRTNFSKLEIQKVNRSYDGTSNVCVLMWNNTAVQTVAYTTTVNYASRVLSFKIDNITDDVVNVNENRNVSIVCEAEGKPLPKIGLYKRGNDNQNIIISEANNVELLYTITVVKCEEAYNYFCQSENSISKDQRYKILTVTCSPKANTSDSYFTTFVGGKASLTFKMIAYPPPNLLAIFYIGSVNKFFSGKIEHENTVSSTCLSKTSYSPMVTCTLTLLNQTVYITGFYTVTFSNTLGNISFVFEVKERLQTTTSALKITEGDKSLQTSLGAGLCAGLGLACVVVIVLVVVIVMQRRMISRQHDDLQRYAYSATAHIPAGNSDAEHVYSEMIIRDIKSQPSYQNAESLNGGETSTNTGQDPYHIYELPKDGNPEGLQE